MGAVSLEKRNPETVICCYKITEGYNSLTKLSQLHCNHFKDVIGTIRSIANFLDKNLSDQVVAKIAKQCSFQEMVKNPKDSLVKDQPGSASFLCKGRVGDWKNHLSDEMAALLKQEVLSKLEGSGLSFDLDGWARPSRVHHALYITRESLHVAQEYSTWLIIGREVYPYC